MSSKVYSTPPVNQLIEDDLFDGETALLDAMFGGAPSKSENDSMSSVVDLPRKKNKPDHYKVVSISLYVEDIAHLDGMVHELKRRGHHKANKSRLIRYALSKVDLNAVPKET